MFSILKGWSLLPERMLCIFSRLTRQILNEYEAKAVKMCTVQIKITLRLFFISIKHSVCYIYNM